MFGWLSGRGPKSNLPEPTALQAQRAKQIEQLKAFNQNVSEIHRDVEYRVNFVVNGTTLSLYITLPPQFPQEQPMVKLSPRAHHSWVNDQMLVSGSPGINNFMVHSDLGKVIREIVDEFQRNPPSMFPQQQYPYSGYPYPVHPNNPSTIMPPTTGPPAYSATYMGYPAQPGAGATSTSTGYPLQYPMATLPAAAASSIPTPSLSASSSAFRTTMTTSAAANTAAHYVPPAGALSNGFPAGMLSNGFQVTSEVNGAYRMPELPAHFPQLTELRSSELQDLVEDEDKLLQAISSSSQVQQLSADREMLCQQNEDLARHSISVKPILEERKRILLEKYDQLNELKRKFDSGALLQDELRLLYDPLLAQDNLKVATVQAEEEAENIAEKFTEGHISVDEFKKTYMEKRKVGHLRKIKEEKLSQLIECGRVTF